MAKSNAGGSGGAAKKAECPVSRQEFTDQAKPVAAKIGDQTVILTPKEFATGSFGFFGNEKMVVMIGDTPVKVQGNLMLTVVGSKEAPAKPEKK